MANGTHGLRRHCSGTLNWCVLLAAPIYRIQFAPVRGFHGGRRILPSHGWMAVIHIKRFRRGPGKARANGILSSITIPCLTLTFVRNIGALFSLSQPPARHGPKRRRPARSLRPLKRPSPRPRHRLRKRRQSAQNPRHRNPLRRKRHRCQNIVTRPITRGLTMRTTGGSLEIGSIVMIGGMATKENGVSHGTGPTRSGPTKRSIRRAFTIRLLSSRRRRPN